MAMVAASGVMAVGCGSDKSASKPSSGAGPTVAVSETEFKLSPANPKVAKTGVVRFTVTNDGKIAHALEVEGPKGEVKTAAIEPGKSATLKADLSKAGSYEWYCPIDGHKKNGMEGKITVAGGGSGGSGGSTSTDDSGGGGNGGY
jgi:uncharacterized cupredoxin-like copper-binding protein